MAERGWRVPTARSMMDGAPERALLDVGGLGVEVRVVDVRTVYGRVQYLVEPVAGMGRRWVEASRVVRLEESAGVVRAEADRVAPAGRRWEESKEERCPRCKGPEDLLIEDDGEHEYIRGRRCRRCGWVHIHE